MYVAYLLLFICSFVLPFVCVTSCSPLCRLRTVHVMGESLRMHSQDLLAYFDAIHRVLLQLTDNELQISLTHNSFFVFI